MARYTVLRLLIFFGFVLLFWLIGLRDNPVLLLAASAIASAALSYVLLRGMRDEMTAKLVERHEARLAAKAQASGDEADEDAEIAGQPTPGLAAAGPAATASGPTGAGSTGAAVDAERPADLISDAPSEERPRSER
ncbi:DUF4229 domain-containing protein [Humibacillus xanthopallidus]|uniref:Uncharacterized protein DUF4229 n=1 Tax=Humibacillus xanthopallidus TaxID=412689 RepID=A0A543I184_9MICO|nr:DUF4229 domain-containing protein [Humibacillus xanthopallidus]TQM64358.1 uncharacterized protein DUF4229 [Humibacillus xanthopallidus]